MSSLIIGESTQSQNAAMELARLCDSLVSKTPITWFGYFRFSRDRKLIALSTSPEVDQHYFENKHYMIDFANLPFEEITNGINYSKSISPSFTAAELQMEYRKQFGLDNFLMIVEKSYDCCHIYMFASKVEQGHMINYYLNNISFLQHFVASNRDKIQSIVDQSDIDTIEIKLDESVQDNSDSIFSQDSASDSNIFLNERQEAMVGLAHSDFSCLTERELQCLKFIIRGLTSKEIANKLKISFRTVENYSARIKYKLGCRRKHDILRKYGAVL